MQITILSVTAEQVPGKKYKKAEVAYRDEAGKVMGKKVMSFVNEEVYNTLVAAQVGEVFEVTSEKDKNNFWQWTAISKTNAGTPATPNVTGGNKPLPSPKSTYETPEERAQKQVYIVRQSSLSSAIAYVVGLKVEVKGTADIINIAKQFEEYVFSGIQQEEEVV